MLRYPLIVCQKNQYNLTIINLQNVLCSTSLWIFKHLKTKYATFFWYLENGSTGSHFYVRESIHVSGRNWSKGYQQRKMITGFPLNALRNDMPHDRGSFDNFNTFLTTPYLGVNGTTCQKLVLQTIPTNCAMHIWKL